MLLINPFITFGKKSEPISGAYDFTTYSNQQGLPAGDFAPWEYHYTGDPSAQSSSTHWEVLDGDAWLDGGSNANWQVAGLDTGIGAKPYRMSWRLGTYTGSSARGGMCLRYLPATANALIVLARPTEGSIQVRDVINGSESTLASFSYTFAVGDWLHAEHFPDGSLKVYVNNGTAPVIDITADSQFSTDEGLQGITEQYGGWNSVQVRCREVAWEELE